MTDPLGNEDSLGALAWAEQRERRQLLFIGHLVRPGAVAVPENSND